MGDGPISNLAITKLLIEHYKNKENSQEISITYHTSQRVSKSGYTRRHILFITDEFVEELQKNILECEQCIINIANKQILDEQDVDGKKLLFYTRLLENIFIKHINKNKFCTAPLKCTYYNVINDDTSNYYEYDYVFFATGTNSGELRKKYFYDANTREDNTIKIIAPESEPIVVFYSKLGSEKINRKY